MSLLTRDEIVYYLGAISEHSIAEVLRSNAEVKDLDSVAMRLAQEDDVRGESVRELSSAALRVYTIVMQDPLYMVDDPEA